MSKEFYVRLAEIQRTLNAPKGQYNSFGKYHYRSCEDILEGVKPLLNGLFLSITDEIVLIGERYYVKATASITDGETTHSASAMAREAVDKKGMDDAQITGATSSYARKYCLNGLFGIDDSKDADTDEHKNQQSAARPQSSSQRKPA
ncbi:MAG: ERF family protein, partial [Pantoea agglomerans]